MKYTWLEDKTSLFFASSFSRLGRFTARNPWKMFIGSLAFFLVCAGGLVRQAAVTENRNEKLWFPQDSQAYTDLAKIERYFPDGSCTAQAILTPDSLNVFTKDTVHQVYRLWEFVHSLEATYEGDTITFEDVCFRRGGQCAELSILDYWDNNITVWNASESIVNDVAQSSLQISRENIFGGQIFSEDDELVVALAVQSFFLFDCSTDKSYLKTEQFLLAYIEGMDTKSEYFPAHHVTYSCSSSLDWEFAKTLADVMGLIVLGFLLVTASMVYGIHHRWGKVNGNVALGFLGMASIFLSMLAGFGLSCALGVAWTPISAVMAFLVLGVGVDDIVVVVSVWNDCDNLTDLVQRNDAAMSHAGAFVTLTSCTSVLAFLVGSVSSFPAVTSFCLTGACCLFFTYLTTITFFDACLVLNARRAAQERYDCCCCFRRKLIKDRRVIKRVRSASKILRQEQMAELAKQLEESENQATGPGDIQFTEEEPDETTDVGTGTSEPIEKRLANLQNSYHNIATWSRDLPFKERVAVEFGVLFTQTGFKAFILCLFTFIVAYSAVEVNSLEQGLKTTQLILDTSYLKYSIEERAKYFEHLGEPLDIYLWDADYYQMASNGLLATLRDEFLACDSVSLPFESPWERFEQYQAVTGGEWPPASSEPQFYADLHTFLAGPGIVFSDWFYFEQNNTKLVASRMNTQHLAYTQSADQLMAMEETRALTARWKAEYGIEVTAFANLYVFWESFPLVPVELVSNLSFALLGITVALFTLIHPGATILIAFTIAAMDLALVAWIPVLGMKLNSITLICVVMSVGIAVDYSAHIAHSFTAAQGTRNDRAFTAVVTMLIPLTKGATSTFLGVALLSAAATYSFRLFFFMISGTVLIGFSFGMLLLPVLLSLVGPLPDHGNPDPAASTFSLELDKYNEVDRSNPSPIASPSVVRDTWSQEDDQ